MTTVARKVAATPARLATDAWQRIIDLLAPTNASARTELAGVVGVASLLITEEAMKSSPIIASGDGPRVRVYCVYGDDAIEGSKVSEAAIADSPVDQDDGWKISLPCASDDLEWVRASVKKRTERITARDVSETQLSEEAGDDNARSANPATINVESFLRP
jgi:hypothetical protein